MGTAELILNGGGAGAPLPLDLMADLLAARVVATPGPIAVHEYDSALHLDATGRQTVARMAATGREGEDAAYLAAAWNAVPDLLAEVRRLRNVVQERDGDVHHLRRVLATYQDEARGDVWFWQGDGDHLESLTCPVVIRPEVLATLLAQGDAPHVQGQSPSLAGPHTEEPDDLACWTANAESAR